MHQMGTLDNLVFFVLSFEVVEMDLSIVASRWSTLGWTNQLLILYFYVVG